MSVPTDREPHPQLPLEFAPRAGATFDSFVPGDNALTVDMLQRFASGEGERQILLWGESGRGKSHLLNAVCHAVAAEGGQIACLPLAELLGFGAALLEGLEALDVVCLDDLQLIAGRADWEEGVFDLINRAREGGTRLLFACDDNPAHTGFKLADLRSRLAWGPVLRLQAAGDEEIAAALNQRAAVLGLELGEGVLRYLLTRHVRDLPGALEQLAELDRASMAAQRRLTVPFVKSVLE